MAITRGPKLVHSVVLGTRIGLELFRVSGQSVAGSLIIMTAFFDGGGEGQEIESLRRAVQNVFSIIM